MHGFTAATDYDWYTYLCTRPDFDEVNFWAPSGRASFGTVPYGSPFFFKLNPNFAKTSALRSFS